ncbi:glycosyltransferase family 2 protein [Thalassospira lohafexi]|uniref:Glycosyl transferase n=1 Tax=Thalassospira lohafexi TaxID=744227 RepID=A0A2N3L707_9PROT|nr:glycosyltransferase family 2 protein [Thalassospira lohafexi]PKR58526.1 glycosyl transferase [Thalassospira lohafexi]
MSDTAFTKSIKPLISIITSTYNAGKHLSDLIDSLRVQDRTGIEWIVVDGGSNDNTIALANDAPDVIDVLISEPDRGIYDAWNKGVAAAKGDWIAFMGADDYYLPNAMDICREAALGAPSEINMIVGTIHWVDASDSHIVRTIASPWDWQKMQKWMNIGHPGTLHHRTLFDRFGMFDISFRSASDYDFLLRVGPNICASFIATPLARVRIGGASQQTQALKEAQQVRRRNLRLSEFQVGMAYVIALTKLAIRRRIQSLKNMMTSR